MGRQAILIVDDVELNRAVLSELFRKDYEILEAEDGLEALRVIERRRDDLVIVLLDIIMPVMDGFAVLKKMKTDHIIGHLPVVMITAENSENTALRGYDLGVSDVINKPFSPSVVRRRVENIIELYQCRFRLEKIEKHRKPQICQAQKTVPVHLQPDLEPSNQALDLSVFQETLNMNALHEGNEEERISKRVLWLLELEREKYRLLSEMSGDIVFSYDTQTDIMEFTENFQQVFGADTKYRHFSLHLKVSEIILDEDRPLLLRTLQGLSPKTPTDSLRIRLVTVGGKPEWFEIYVNSLWNKESGTCAGYMGKIININDMKSEADRWREEAYRDPLTQLYNRKAVEELALQMLGAKSNGQERAILFFVDIDNFKLLNDQLGHLFGDDILRYVGREMHRRFRSSDIVGRIGGDEFVVLADGTFPQAEIIRKAEDLCNIFRNNPFHERLDHPISGSVGIARYPEDGKSYIDLLHKADLALYRAKSQGKNRYAFFDELLEGL